MYDSGVIPVLVIWQHNDQTYTPAGREFGVGSSAPETAMKTWDGRNGSIGRAR